MIQNYFEATCDFCGEYNQRFELAGHERISDHRGMLYLWVRQRLIKEGWGIVAMDNGAPGHHCPNCEEKEDG